MRSVSLLWKLFAGLAGLSVLTALLVGVLVLPRLAAEEERAEERALAATCILLDALAADALRAGTSDGLRADTKLLQDGGLPRLTVVRADGRVLFDTERDPALMDDHGRRPEILDARREGYGTSIRFSDTVRSRMLYVARPVERDERLLGYVRAARSLQEIDERKATLRSMVVGAAAAAVLASLLLAMFISRRLTRPLRAMLGAVTAIGRGDYDRPVPVSSGDELGRLAASFNAMSQQLRERIDTISRERRELRAILTGMEEGVVAVDRDERVVLMNAAAGRILGSDVGEGVGRRIWEVTRLREVGESLVLAVQHGRPEEREVRLPGRPRDRVLQLHAAPLGTPTGAAQGAVLVLHDITKLRHLEKVRQDFVANVSHELKTPLAAIRGFVETILEDPEMPGDVRADFLERVRRQATRLSEMVEEVLMLSRLDSERPAVALERVDVAEIVREAVLALLPQAAAKKIEVRLEGTEEEVLAAGNEEALRRIAGNLVDNALKYTPSDGHVWVRLVLEDDHVVLEVADDGIGIPPEVRERVFERFFRVDPGRSRAAGGTGLGLSIVKHLVQLQGGSVGVEPGPDGGSLFRVRLRRGSNGGSETTERNGS